MDVIPIDQATSWAPGLPSPERDQQSAIGKVSAEARAKRSVEFHRRGLDSRRLRDLTAEKYLLHVDGEGDGQWYDIYNGQKLQMAPRLNGFSPTQDNQLRPILDNFVAHLTTQPYRFVVEPLMDRKSRQAALIDQAIVNAEVRGQKWNALMAEAKYLAACTGFCPIHSMWRDQWHDQAAFEAVIASAQPGFIDSWVGDPFRTVANAGARRGSAHRISYERTLPADLVRAAFPQAKIEGTDRVPSASLFQRTVQKWVRTGGITHGHSELTTARGHEEVIGLLYEEILPGYDPDFPGGGLVISALNGAASVRAEDGRASAGNAVFLWAGPLPANRFSSIITYSHHRFDDWHGKPYIGDLDDDQVELNQRLVILKEYQRRASKPQLGGSAEIEQHTIGWEQDQYFEVQGMVGGGSPMLQWLEYPNAHIPVLLNEIQTIQERLFRKGGWQAASQGASVEGSGKKVIALQQADDSIMGPISQRTSEELEDLATLNWHLRKEFMDEPQVLSVVGDELAHMVEPYVDRTMMSDRAPVFTLVSGFGTSTEAKAQQLMNLLGATDAMGEPVLTARQFRKNFPDNSLYHETDDPRDVRERRPRVVNEMIRQAAEEQAMMLQQQFPQWQPAMGDPFTKQAGLIVEMTVAQTEDVLMDDDLEGNIEMLSVITQDPTEHPVARYAAQQRQMRYFMWLAGQQQQTMAQAAPGAPAPGPGEPQQPQSGAGGKPSAQEAFNPAAEGGTPTAESMVQADQKFSREVA